METELVDMGHKTILYVEDNLSNVKLMKGILGSFPNVNLITTQTAEKGIELAKFSHPNLIIMDTNLPGMSGNDAVQQLKYFDSTKNIPVIGLSADAMEINKQQALEAGCEIFLSKPVNIVELISHLKKLLNVFLDSEKHFADLSSFKENDIEIDDEFLFHMQILEDQNFIKAYNEENFLGYNVALGGNFEWFSQILRLTASGHEFADALNKKEIFEVLSKEFKNSSVATLVTVSKELMLAFAKEQAKKYFEL